MRFEKVLNVISPWENVPLHTYEDDWQIDKQKLSAGVDVKKLELSFVAGGGCKVLQPHWKTVYQFLTNLNLHIT